MPRRALPRAFFARDTVRVAQDLLGKVVVVGAAALRIVETEAYSGTDPASHSRRGPTPRCAVMFGRPGVAYVYFIYGMHTMLNFVTEPAGTAGAVLIRAGEPLAGLAPGTRADGPGRLCRALGITLAYNKKDLRGPEIRVVDDGFKPGPLRASRRVGLSAGTEKLWRFFIASSPHVTRCAENRSSVPMSAGRAPRRGAKNGIS